MTDQAALLRSILEAPADDAPRLVYADWLEEHDDPMSAAFFRLPRPADILGHWFRRNFCRVSDHRWSVLGHPMAGGAYGCVGLVWRWCLRCGAGCGRSYWPGLSCPFPSHLTGVSVGLTRVMPVKEWVG